MYHYPIAIEPGDDTHAFGVEVPDIPGCFSAGDTLDAAIRGAVEAIELHLESLAEEGQQPPLPSEAHAIKDNSRYAGYYWALASVDETPYLGKSEKLNVTLPRFVTHQIDQFTQTHPDYKNRSHFLQVAARKLLAEGV